MEKPLGHETTKQKGFDTNQLVLTLLIVALSVMFIALTVAYLFSQTTWTWGQFRFPKIFLISTMIMVASSLTLHKSIAALSADNLENHQKLMGYTLLLGLAFLAFQVIGWLNLQSQGIFFNGKPDGSYLYLISGLHALHLIAGVGVLFVLYWKARSSNTNAIGNLLLASNAEHKAQMKLIAKYWHFVDILWLYLLVFFLFNHL